MNKCFLIGRLCADPDLRVTQSGTSVASYRLAVDRRYKKDGQPEADFINCVAWSGNADFAGKYLRKGMRIAIEGRIQTGSYTKDDGTKVYTTDVIVEHHEFCEKKQDNGSATAEQLFAPPQQVPEPQQAYTDIEYTDDDLPF
ncbi:MAG: single-stranded DNA-binding protein [Christensenellales bacterium]